MILNLCGLLVSVRVFGGDIYSGRIFSGKGKYRSCRLKDPPQGFLLRRKFLPGQGWWSTPFFLPTHSNTFFSTTPTILSLSNFIMTSRKLLSSLENEYRSDMWLKSYFLTQEIRKLLKYTSLKFLTRENICTKFFYMFFTARLHKFFVRFREFLARLFPRPGPEQSSNVQLRTFSRSSQIFSIVEIEVIPPLNSQLANFQLVFQKEDSLSNRRLFLYPFSETFCRKHHIQEFVRHFSESRIKGVKPFVEEKIFIFILFIYSHRMMFLYMFINFI